MVNRQQLNEIAIRMGLKKITLYNKMDGSLKVSQIFGNTLEALVGAIYLDHGYKKDKQVGARLHHSSAHVYGRPGNPGDQS